MPTLAAQLFANDGIIHRLLVDERGDFVFGCGLRAEPLREQGRFRVFARPLDPRLEARLRARSSSARKTDAASLSTPQISTPAGATPARIVTEADSFALDLGDTIIRYKSRTSEFQTFEGTPLTSVIREFRQPAITTHNFQFSAGVGFRF